VRKQAQAEVYKLEEVECIQALVGKQALEEEEVLQAHYHLRS
jgi:hypothetical protein